MSKLARISRRGRRWAEFPTPRPTSVLPTRTPPRLGFTDCWFLDHHFEDGRLGSLFPVLHGNEKGRADLNAPGSLVGSVVGLSALPANGEQLLVATSQPARAGGAQNRRRPGCLEFTAAAFEGQRTDRKSVV